MSTITKLIAKLKRPSGNRDQLYLATVDFQTEAQALNNSSFSIQQPLRFIDGDATAAAAAVNRWWRASQAASPDYFHRLLTITVWTGKVQRIGDDGVLAPESESDTIVYEWSDGNRRPLPWSSDSRQP